MRSSFAHIAEEMRREIEELLSGIGLLFRVFARGKDSVSLRNKIDREPGKYFAGGRLIQDAIGIRVALYFQDDINIVKSILESRFKLNLVDSTIDAPDRDQFAVTRYNLVFQLPAEASENFKRLRGGDPLDLTFEVQLRSVLSEGWHEVEHDLRYKAKDDWVGHDDLSRVLNGIVATLETSEWSMGKIFDELAYRHYRAKNWQGMLPSLVRMRLKGRLSHNILTALNFNAEVAKDLLRIDRGRLLRSLSRARPKLPVTPDNVVLFWNSTGPGHPCLDALTSEVVRDAAVSLTSIK